MRSDFMGAPAVAGEVVVTESCHGIGRPPTSSAQARSSAATTPEQRAHMAPTAADSHGAICSRSTGLPARMGKATADLKTKVPDEVKLAFGQLAHSCGLTESELLRDMVVLRLFGREAVLSMQQDRLLMVAGSETERGAT